MQNTTNQRPDSCLGCPMASACNEQMYVLDGHEYCSSKLAELGYSVCDDCGAVVRMDELTAVSNGNHVCTSCLDNSYAECDDCGDYFPLDELTEVSGGDRVCESCRDSDYAYCEHCGEYVCESEIYVVDAGTSAEQYVCEDCLEYNDGTYFRCANCGDWHTYSHDCARDVHGYGEICDNCYGYGNFGYCDGCNEYFHDDDLHYNEEDGNTYCEDCWADIEPAEDERHKLQRYGYKPTPIPRTRKKCTCNQCSDIPELLFGLELEVDKGEYRERDAAISEIADASEDVYMKSDGSLDTGFEIVTHPCTLEYHMYQFKWRHITSIAKKHGFKSHDARTCGLHVHVGRYQLGDGYDEQKDTIAKVLLLVDRHWDALVKFSRRNPSQLDRWAARPAIDRPRAGETDAIAMRKALRADNGNRYQAVNLCNSGTIEFRLFNGTLKRDTIIATIQLLSNLCLYAKGHTATECMTSKWSDLTQFTQYEELDNYCQTQGLTDVDDPAPVQLHETPIAPVPGEPLAIDQIAVGMSVRLSANTSVVGLPPEAIGIVQCVGRSPLPVGVAFPEFPDWDGGHSLGGRLSTNIGRWFNPEDLIPA